MDDDQRPKAKLPSALVGAGAIALAVVAYFAIGTLTAEDETLAQAPAREPFTVLVREARGADRPVAIQMRGRTEAGRQVAVRAETTGRIVALPATEGQDVASGDLLCRLEDAGRAAALAEAEAAATRVRADAAAAERLFAEGFAAAAQRDTARAALRGAEAALERAAKAAGDTEVRAPIGGTVSSVPVEPGDVLAAGAVCAVVSDLSTVVIAGDLGAAEAASVRVGDAASARVDGEALPARVRFVSPVADPATRAFRVELEAAQSLRDGLSATARIDAAPAAASLVPRGAVVLGDDGRVGVRVAEGGADQATVAFVPVSVVGETAEGAYVAGLPPGARVIVRGQEYVSAGTTVRVAEEAPRGAGEG